VKGYTKPPKKRDELVDNNDSKSGLRLEGSCIPLVPLSVNFIDPSDEEGVAVLSPPVFEHKSDQRPWFLLSKREHFPVFQAYWTAYQDSFEHGERLGVDTPRSPTPK
jgi:hypothetical protein